MRGAVTLGIMVLCGTLAVAQTGTTPAQSQSGAAAAVKQVADNYVKAALAGDAKAIVALYADDATEMPPNRAAVKGRAALEQYYDKQMAGAKMTSFTIDHLETHTSANVGYDVGTYTQTLTPSQGQPMNDTGKYIVIVKRVGGAWKISYVIYNSDLPPHPQP